MATVEDSEVAAIVGSTVGGVAVLLCLSAAYLLYRRQTRKRRSRAREERVTVGVQPSQEADLNAEEDLHKRSVVHTLMVEAVDSLVGGLDALRVLHTATEAHVEENRFANPPSELVFGRPATAALGVEHYMCVPREAVLQGLIDGTAAVIREVSAGGTDDDRECLDYILHAEAGSSEQTYQGGLKRDCDERGRVLACRTVADSSGVVRGMRLEDFVSHRSARLANLTEAHVVALRLYTTQASSLSLTLALPSV